MPPPVSPITEEHLTTLDERVYYTLESTVTIAAGAVALVPVGWIELERNSKFELSDDPAFGDVQVRTDRGHASEGVINKAHSVTLDLKLKHGEDPANDMLIEGGTLMKLLRVRSDGNFVFLPKVSMAGIKEGGDVAGLPVWTGTCKVNAHPVRGKIAPWPPVVGP